MMPGVCGDVPRLAGVIRGGIFGSEFAVPGRFSDVSSEATLRLPRMAEDGRRVPTVGRGGGLAAAFFFAALTAMVWSTCASSTSVESGEPSGDEADAASRPRLDMLDDRPTS